MWSLDKFYEDQGVAPLNDYKDRTNSPKLDGAAISLLYIDGTLVQALTRGDGIEGMDITNKIKYMIPGNIPEIIKTDSPTIEIRGEVIIAVPIFEKKYNQYKNL